MSNFYHYTTSNGAKIEYGIKLRAVLPECPTKLRYLTTVLDSGLIIKTYLIAAL